MTLSNDMGGGLSPDHELFFPERPANPDMRESTSIWLFEENGAFAIPRVGIEGEAHSWDNRLYHANLAFPDGRVLHDTGRGPAPSPFDADGRPTIFGADPMTFRMIEPFRRWAMTFDGTARDTTVADQIAGNDDSGSRIPLKYEIEMEMVAPSWVQDNSPEKVALMSPREQADAKSMGIGWRLEQVFRASGTLTVDGETRSFRAVGNRIKRQSVRPLDAFRGHVWQAACFPDGRAFALCTYPPAEDGSTYNDAYVYQDGVMQAARATRIPWLRRLMPHGDDASLELVSDRGVAQIRGTTAFATFRVNNKEMGDRGFTLQQSGALYEWDGQTAFGMIERSAFDSQIER